MFVLAMSDFSESEVGSSRASDYHICLRKIHLVKYACLIYGRAMISIPGPQSSRAMLTWRWLREPTELLDECADKFGEIFCLKTYAHNDIMIVSNIEAIQQIFAATYDDVHQRKHFEYNRFLGHQSMFVLEGIPHQQMRRSVMPALGPSQMKGSLALVSSLADEALDTWPLNTKVSIQSAMQALLLQTTLKLLLGAAPQGRVDSLARVFSDTYEAFASPLMIVPLKLQARYGYGPWNRLVRLSEQARALLQAEICERRSAGQMQGVDVLSALLSATHPSNRLLTDEEICDSLLALFMAGHHTTANALSWSFDSLLQSPEAHRRLQEEVREHWNGDAANLERVLSLPILDATVREVLRLRPIFPVTTRILARPMRLLGYDLPANTVVVPCIYLAQRRPDAFPQPHKFLPERFLHQGQAPPEWMPFGGGVRRCVGSSPVLMQMKVILATILRRATMDRFPGPPAKMVRAFISIAPSGGVPAVLTARADSRSC